MKYRQQTWREYQNQLQRAGKKRTATKGVLFLILFAFTGIGIMISINMFTGPEAPSAEHKKEAPPVQTFWEKKDFHPLMAKNALFNSGESIFTIPYKGESVTIETTLDPELQRTLLSKIATLNTLGRGEPRYLAITAIIPSTGEIVAMVGYDKQSDFDNICLTSIFPAASLFKIITASAAIDKFGYTSGSRLRFNGNKYTLYKNQLKKRNNKYTNKISLENSFAQSINPVFGKIGFYDLGKKNLQSYGEAFGFNKQFNFELPVEKSQLVISDTPYNWAEIACGFNNDTVISPLHAALIACTVVNGGKLPEPTIIKKAVDSNGKTLYESTSSPFSKAVAKNTSTEVKKLMARTISAGTCRKSFRHYKRDPILSSLYIGGKTGSLYNTSHDVKFDWFTGYAEEKNGQHQIAVSVVVGHEKYIGRRAATYAKQTIKDFFLEKKKINRLQI